MVNRNGCNLPTEVNGMASIIILASLQEIHTLNHALRKSSLLQLTELYCDWQPCCVEILFV